jgi:hypothetical protein
MDQNQTLSTTALAPNVRVHVSTRPGVASVILGARTHAQLEDNLASLDVELSSGQWRTLEAASAIELGFPHDFLATDSIREVAFGGANVSTASPHAWRSPPRAARAAPSKDSCRSRELHVSRGARGIDGLHGFHAANRLVFDGFGSDAAVALSTNKHEV